MTDEEEINNMDKVQKIREEVARIQLYSQSEVLKQVLDYIDEVQKEPISIWHDASEKPEREDLVIETNDGRLIHRQSINNYGMVQRWAYTSDLLNLDNSCNFGKNLQKELVSENLEEASKEWLRPQLDKSYANYGEAKMMELTHFDGYAMLDAIEFGAKWQKEQDQSTIELAEDHAMLAGMEKMKEQMMKGAIDAVVHIEASNYPYIPQIELYDYDKDEPLAEEGDKYKIILIKEE